MNELAGQSLGGYLLDEEIGHGSMGVVYRGKQVALGREVAIKVLPRLLARDTSYIARFIREAQIIAGLNHPNIVQIYDAGQQNKLLYFVMEYVQGPTLSSLLHLDGSIPLYLAAEYAAEIADALDAAYHERNVIHRDIKPENLMLNRWGKIKVMDFGLARATGHQKITVAKTLVGSIYYASPEQIWGEVLDNRSDVYALGVVLYEMVTGLRPFNGRSMPELTQAIIRGNPRPPGMHVPNIPPALEQIILTALSVDREQRYPEAGMMALQLRNLNLKQAPVAPLTGLLNQTQQTQHTGQNRVTIHPPKRPAAQRPSYLDMDLTTPVSPEPASSQSPSYNQQQGMIQQAQPMQSAQPTHSVAPSTEIVPYQQISRPPALRRTDEETTVSLASLEKHRTFWDRLQELFKPPR